LTEQRKTSVVCDTTAYMPDQLTADLEIQRVSLYVTLGGEQRREMQVEDYAGFFERLSESEQGATTSQPSVGDFLNAYQPEVSAGRDVVSLHISAGISGTYDSALQAREQLGADAERIHVYDSRSSAGGLALCVIAAARAAREGADAAEVLQRAEEARAKLRMWFAVDTLEYLRKGGRIGAARAFLGSALQIKPILTLEEEITPIERVRTRGRVFERLLEYARELHEAGLDGWVVQHIQDPENAQRLVEAGREIFGSEPIFVSEVGPVLGAHTGPGLLGIGGVPRHLVG